MGEKREKQRELAAMKRACRAAKKEMDGIGTEWRKARLRFEELRDACLGPFETERLAAHAAADKEMGDTVDVLNKEAKKILDDLNKDLNKALYKRDAAYSKADREASEGIIAAKKKMSAEQKAKKGKKYE
ncbi:MAG: hypothetical protein MUP21_02370 [Dehalococcoidia bacterium]|nr:hypothetical protein [Dehalococcoidia bacterium]